MEGNFDRFARYDPANLCIQCCSHKFGALLAANELVESNFPGLGHHYSDKFFIVVFLVELEREGRVEVDIAQESFLVVAEEAYLLVETFRLSSILCGIVLQQFECILQQFECMAIYIWFRSIQIVVSG